MSETIRPPIMRQVNFIVLSLTLAIAVGCAQDAAPATTINDSGVRLDATKTPIDNPADAGHAVESACPAPIPEGELAHQASGSSVFGRVLGGDLGVFDALGGTGCGVRDVRVCLLGTDTCTASDAAGQYVLSELPPSGDVQVSFEKSEFASVIVLVQLNALPINLRVTRIVTLSSILRQRQELGLIAQDDSRGSIVAAPVAAGEGVGGLVVPDGVTITLLPDGQTPLYSRGEVEPGGFSSDDLLPSLSATRRGGWGIFYDVDPGDYVVRFERDHQVCAQTLPGGGYGVDAAGNVRIKVLAGFTTGSVLAFCP